MGTNGNKKLYERQIMYWLTEEEIGIVEGRSKTI
jgi:hypothetical protein